MSPEKLEALRALAADERTPENEARNAALLYVRAGGRGAAAAPSAGPSVEQLGAQLAEMETERDKWREKARRAEAQADRIVRLADEIRQARAPQPSPKANPFYAPGDPFPDFADFFRKAGIK